MSLLNAAVVEKEAVEMQMVAASNKGPTSPFEEGLNRAVTLLDSSIKILELEPPASTELRWLQAAREVRQQVFDLTATIGGAKAWQ